MRTLPTAAFIAVVTVACGGPGPTLTPSRVFVPAGISLTAQPSVVLRTGSSSEITVLLTERDGTLVPNTQVRFGTTSGTLSSTDVLTNDVGIARVTLTASRDAIVAVTAPPPAQQATIAVSAVAPFSIDLTNNHTPAFPDDTSVSVRIVPTLALPFAPLSSPVTLQCGVAPAASLGSVAGNLPTTLTSTCTFPSVGNQIVTAAASGPNGWSTSNNMTVAVVARPGVTAPPAVPGVPPTSPRFDILGTIISTNTTAQTQVWSFLLDSTYTINSAAWIFGDGSEASGKVVTHTYAYGGYDLRVNAVDADGNTRQASRRLIVKTPLP